MANPEGAHNGEQERARAILEMGFDAIQALLLAATRAEGRHVDLTELKAMLDAGCDHALALRILV